MSYYANEINNNLLSDTELDEIVEERSLRLDKYTEIHRDLDNYKSSKECDAEIQDLESKLAVLTHPDSFTPEQHTFFVKRSLLFQNKLYNKILLYVDNLEGLLEKLKDTINDEVEEK